MDFIQRHSRNEKYSNVREVKGTKDKVDSK
jgi:hypothetical protein